jgi:hypothetical protein
MNYFNLRRLVLVALFVQTSNAHEANALLQRAIDAAGIANAKGRILHFNAVDALMQTAQSDRMYPPYYPMFVNRETWVDIDHEVERIQSSATFFGSGPSKPTSTIVGKSQAVFVRDTLLIPIPGTKDMLNVWNVLLDWSRSPDLSMGKQEVYREYLRIVIRRKGRFGEERLFLDPKSGLPVKYEFTEPHFLWGQVKVEYLYTTWITVEKSMIPSGVVKIVDGEPEAYRSVGESKFIAPESAPSLQIPETTAQPPAPSQPGVLASPQPDSIRVSDNLILTRNRWYQEAISLIDGTLYIFDATLGENRGKQDSAWIAKALPGKHPIVVVVTDLAWPHIAGVRYWVSRGATVVSHRMSEPFLKKVVDRRWTLNPDELERNRKKSKFKFLAVDSKHSMANGKVQLYAIDGIGSEGALIAYLPEEKFLWAGDYIQNVTAPSAYAKEVRAAVERVGIKPGRVAAQHIRITNWNVIETLFKGANE